MYIPRLLRIASATDFFSRGPSNILRMFSQVTGVCSLSNQLWSILDNLTPLGELELNKPSRVLEPTPRRSPISYHLAETQLRCVKRANFSGFVATKEN